MITEAASSQHSAHDGVMIGVMGSLNSMLETNNTVLASMRDSLEHV